MSQQLRRDQIEERETIPVDQMNNNPDQAAMIMNHEMDTIREQNRIIESQNDREFNKIRKKIKVMKVKNWLVGVNSPLH
jgi:hypothetical protein